MGSVDLKVGTKIKIGPKYAKEYDFGFKAGEVITLVLGQFYYHNGLCDDIETAPSIWDEERREFHSIYHLFENDLSEFMDCEII